MNVTVSTGPDLVDVPDVTGQTQEEAIQALRDAGLSNGQVTPRTIRR